MDLSVIIVEYLDLKSLERAISSIYYNINNLITEIIVISNSSYSIKRQVEIRSNFCGPQFIFNDKNLGFGKAVNQGIKVSSGKFIMLLNPDARLLDNSLENAVDFMTQNRKIAIIGPMTLDGDGKLHDTFRKFMSIRSLLSRTVKRFLNNGSGKFLENTNYLKAKRVDWVSGGCLLGRRSAIEKTGLLDERYFMYMEDMDWCRRFWQNGFEVWFLPEWKIEHIGGKGSTKRLGVTNRLMWIHTISYCKYYFKWLHFKIPF